jgi:hypothetical protein
MEFADFETRYRHQGLHPDIAEAATHETVVPSATPTALLRAITHAAHLRRSNPSITLAEQRLDTETLPQDDVAAHMLAIIINASLAASEPTSRSRTWPQNIPMDPHRGFDVEVGLMGSLQKLSSYQDLSGSRFYITEDRLPTLLVSVDVDPNIGLALCPVKAEDMIVPAGSLIAFSYDPASEFENWRGGQLAAWSSLVDGALLYPTPLALDLEHRQQDFTREILYLRSYNRETAAILETWTAQTIQEHVKIALS